MRELPNGKIQVYLLDLTDVTKERFQEIRTLLDRAAFSLADVPGKQMLKVYWSYADSIAEFIAVSEQSVHPCP